MNRRTPASTSSQKQSGNVFFAIFAAVAVIGVLGATVMTFVKGPLTTSMKMTRQTVAENQMLIGAQVAVMNTASQANNGDCDGDNVIEPVAWRDPAALPHPTNGGLLPSTIGINKKDPWGTEYGYCVWDHGITRGAVACGSGTGMLEGTDLPGTFPVVAIISAGQDKIFNTTCRTFPAADANSDFDLLDGGDHQLAEKTTGSDDIIFTYTYEEAISASGGLWSLKSSSPNTATIGKNIEVAGTGKFDRVGSMGSDYLEVLSGIKLANPSTMPICNAANAGVMRMNASGNSIEMCDGVNVWKAISGGDTTDLASNSLPCDSTNIGKVRYNASSGAPEFCNGAQWLPFTINTPGVTLVISPTSITAMNVSGTANVDPLIAGVCDDGLSACGNPRVITLANSGALISDTIVISLDNTANFYIKAETCTIAGGDDDGKLSPSESCTITVIPRSTGNVTYEGKVQIIANNSPFTIMRGTSTNFGCAPGRVGAGGVYASCGLTDPGTGLTYDLIVMPGGCNGSVTNPTCPGSTDTYTRMHSPNCCTGTVCSAINNFCGEETYGARAAAIALGYTAISSFTFPAMTYCDTMDYNGKTDWYLPARVEFRDNIWINRAAIGGFSSSSGYITSHTGSGSDVGFVESASGNLSGHYNTTALLIRCARRENIALPTTPTDVDPSDVGLRTAVVFNPSETATSNTVTVNGILQTISASITGATGMDIIKNGAAQGSTSISGLRPGDTLAFRMTAPAVLGTQATATIQIGTDTYTWKAGYADSSRTAKAFVTSTTYRAGEINGLAGGDTICTQRAAASSLGLSGNWKAILSSSTVDAASRIPWNWGTLQNLAGTTITTNGLNGLFDGSLDTTFNRTEMNTTFDTNVWTGSTAFGSRNTANSSSSPARGFAYDWTAINCCGTAPASYGRSYAPTTQTFYYSTADSDNYMALYCIENIDETSDTVPNPPILAYKIQVPTGSTQSSVPWTVSGMSGGGVSTTLSVSGTNGNPRFTVNGGAEVTSASIVNGDIVVFIMDAAATASTSHKMTISAPGLTPVLWRVWTGVASGSVVKRVFVTSVESNGQYYSGVAGADAECQARASGASLGGTWKAIISGTAEVDWAVNRVGYNWTELRQVDNSTIVAYAPNLFDTLQAPINKDEFGNPRTAVLVHSGTGANGIAYSLTPNISNFWNWTSSPCSATYYQAGSDEYKVGITKYPWLCTGNGNLFCIEQ